MKPTKVLEVGSLYGGTLYYWIKCARPGTKIISVDRIANNKEHPINKVLDSRKLWKGWAETARVNLIEIIGSSTDYHVVDAMKEFGPYNFIFVTEAMTTKPSAQIIRTYGRLSKGED